MTADLVQNSKLPGAVDDVGDPSIFVKRPATVSYPLVTLALDMTNPTVSPSNTFDGDKLFPRALLRLRKEADVESLWN